MSKSFNELMNEASHGRTECALLVNFTRTFNDYAHWNLENELNNQPKLCAHFNKYVGDRINYLTNAIYWDNESQSIPSDIYSIDDFKVCPYYNDKHSNCNENYHSFREEQIFAWDLMFIDLPIDEDVYNAS